MVRRAALVVLALLATTVAACDQPKGGGQTATTPSPSPAATGPATQDITLTGDPVLTAALANATIECRGPRLGGLVISVTGSPPGQSANARLMVITIRDHDVKVR